MAAPRGQATRGPPAHCEATGRRLSEPFRGRLGVLQASHGRRGDGSSSSSTTLALWFGASAALVAFVATGQSECFARLGVWARADPPPALRPAPLSCVCVRVRACVCACACVLVGSCACVRARPGQAVAADPFAIEQCPIGFRFHTVTARTPYKIAEPILADPSVPPPIRAR
jgi:hypothetical protein